jgi:probable DNA metabolism protein
MPERTALIYCYDGSFEGLLCCVFESYDQDELPSDILPQDADLPLLLPIKTIITDKERARRVRQSIPAKMGHQAYDVVRRAFLTCHPQKELLILQFLRLGYQCGPSIMRRLTDETVHALFTAVLHLDNEAGLLRGFVRFSEANGALTALIEPKNTVLPLIARHFCERYPNEKFLIYDKVHRMALLHANRKWTITGVEEYGQPAPGEEELKYRALWQLFYDTIEVEGRHNERCRMTHMPMRYWSCMTEFARDLPAGGNTALPEGASLLTSANGEDEV